MNKIETYMWNLGWFNLGLGENSHINFIVPEFGKKCLIQCSRSSHVDHRGANTTVLWCCNFNNNNNNKYAWDYTWFPKPPEMIFTICFGWWLEEKKLHRPRISAHKPRAIWESDLTHIDPGLWKEKLLKFFFFSSHHQKHELSKRQLCDQLSEQQLLIKTQKLCNVMSTKSLSI